MLSVKALSTEYAGGREVVRAARDISFDVPAGKLFTLLGPSGCGKTTTLRSIAGLERPQSGEVAVDGEIVSSAERGIFVAPNRRNFGMVFQSYAIWPHMNVFQNAAFPLEVLLLLDEPLSNLDAKLRERMRFELKRIQRDLGITTVYVTHDQSEALALSNEIAVMKDGRIIQVGAPRDVYERPSDRFVADFVGTTNFLNASVVESDGEGRCRVDTPLGALKARCVERLGDKAAVVVSIRPEDVELSESAPEGADADNVCVGTVEAKAFLGDHLDFQVKVSDFVLLARVHPSLRTPVGERIYVRMPMDKCLAVPDTGARGRTA